MMIQADKRIDVETTFAGDIAALVGLKNITTVTRFAMRSSRSCSNRLRSKPVISMAVEPKTKADRERW